MVGLETDVVALFVYLDMNTNDFYGVFSDNGFHMTEAEQTVTYKTESSWKVCADDIVRNLIVKSLADVYISNCKFIERLFKCFYSKFYFLIPKMN